MARALVVRLDSVGDVLLSGPAVRAVASRYSVTYLASSIGAEAAALLPGVDEVIRFDAPWILADPPSFDESTVQQLASIIRRRRFDVALILASARQSSLPTAMVLRMAGVRFIVGISRDYPGSLLDVRIPGDPDVHEVEQSLMVAEAIGCALPFDDDRGLHVRTGDQDWEVSRSLPARSVVVPPGSSVPSRSLGSAAWQQVVRTLVKDDIDVVLTGTKGEDQTGAIRRAGGDRVTDLIGRTTLGTLGRVIGGARGICVGNTGAMHLAAAVNTPVVAIMPPTVPTNRWRPWMVPHRILGDQQIECRCCYRRVCPLPRQECLSSITGESVVAALIALDRDTEYAGAVGGAQ